MIIATIGIAKVSYELAHLKIMLMEDSAIVGRRKIVPHQSCIQCRIWCKILLASALNCYISVLQSVSHREHGICDIEQEITSPQNPRFVVHDSRGVWARSGRPSEFGENISSRAWKGRAEGSSTRRLASFFCGVWIFIEVCFRLCIQVPFAGGRVFEKGDEELLKLGLKSELSCRPSFRKVL